MFMLPILGAITITPVVVVAAVLAVVVGLLFFRLVTRK